MDPKVEIGPAEADDFPAIRVLATAFSTGAVPGMAKTPGSSITTTRRKNGPRCLRAYQGCIQRQMERLLSPGWTG